MCIFFGRSADDVSMCIFFVRSADDVSMCIFLVWYIGGVGGDSMSVFSSCGGGGGGSD